MVVIPPKLPPKRLLLVEDDRCVRETTLDLLSFTGLSAHAVECGEEAAAFLEANTVDIVLTDLAMPRGDGVWLVRWIRSNSKCARIVVVMMSAHVLNAQVEMGLEAGADYYLTKPFEPDRFIDFISRLGGGV